MCTLDSSTLHIANCTLPTPQFCSVFDGKLGKRLGTFAPEDSSPCAGSHCILAPDLQTCKLTRDLITGGSGSPHYATLDQCRGEQDCVLNCVTRITVSSKLKFSQNHNFSQFWVCNKLLLVDKFIFLRPHYNIYFFQVTTLKWFKNRPSKCLQHHQHRWCKTLWTGVDLLI